MFSDRERSDNLEMHKAKLLQLHILNRIVTQNSTPLATANLQVNLLTPGCSAPDVSSNGHIVNYKEKYTLFLQGLLF